MRFLIDEDLPRSTAALLVRYGYEVIDIRDTGLRGAADADVADYAQKQGCCLLTGDSGFGHIGDDPPGKYAGIVVLHLPEKATVTVILDLLERFLKRADIIPTISGKLAIVDSSRIRIRKG